MNGFRGNYSKILEALNIVAKKGSFILQKRKPKLKDIKQQFNNCMILRDNVSSDIQLDLFKSKQIKIGVPVCKTNTLQPVYNS